MQKNEVIEFLEKIDKYVGSNYKALLEGSKFELKIIGKCALLLAGMKDTTGTVDIDSLRIEGGAAAETNQRITESLSKEFGKTKLIVHGYYLEFVGQATVFLPSRPQWKQLTGRWTNISVEFLEPHAMIASKCFSAFSIPPRKKDQQDIKSALDQKLIGLQKMLDLADSIFDACSLDARSERFPRIYKYITEELMPNYGGGNLKYRPPEE